ncbi:DUF7010 family protein [Pseudidiomarina taiwanensis]|uniref:Uncharacterized protein n=1 Tax=Pseudidiomarina taiwanensis TaxID=337250 RepID=A0A432ZCL3_9GAMM|nr:hypothetical protein [Pseudidiomarina taiwanensis]RUO75703.1 hypothetical protein CWI83_10025 [Pseudidiomarina taiwanensis]
MSVNSGSSLEQQRQEFAQRRLIATPLAGLIAWSVVAVCSLFMDSYAISMTLFIATGSIVYLALPISKLTGEDFLNKQRPKNTFDTLFYYTIGMSVLVYAIAIPFFLIDYTSLPLSVGILTGLMWLPISWIIQHWIGFVHAILRTLVVVSVWYLFPEHRFFAVSVAIVTLYIGAIIVLERRWRALQN